MPLITTSSLVWMFSTGSARLARKSAASCSVVMFRP